MELKLGLGIKLGPKMLHLLRLNRKAALLDYERAKLSKR